MQNNYIDIKNQMNEYADSINKALINSLPEANDGQREVVRAMKYSLENGGKRIRPILVLEFCKACGGDVNAAMPLACAVEFIHTYSLIHDDLPCMDDDDLRRGKPSCHKMFGEANALLAGDALLTHAFELATNANIKDENALSAVALLAQNAGVGGMIGGQVLDLMFERYTPSLSEVLTVDKLKTGALISAACILGCLAADATDEQIAAASNFAYSLGIAFQIKDDLLDINGDEEKLGKPIGSDEEKNKKTYVSMVGQEKAEIDVQRLTAAAIEQLSVFSNTDFLEGLSNYLIYRDN